MSAVRIDPTLETVTRTGHVVTSTRMPRSAAALYETRVSLAGKEVCLWDCNSEREAAEQHAELVEKFGGAPIEAPWGLTSAEYIKLALDCLDQAGLSRRAQQIVMVDIRSALDTDGRTCRLVGEGLDEARIEIEARCAQLAARAS